MFGPLLLPEHGNTTTFDYGLCPQHNFTKQFRHELLAYLGCLVMFDIPMIVATHAVKLSDPPLPAHFSATTILDTTGYGCFMKPSSTSRHELTF
jgi:hypothetical protein